MGEHRYLINNDTIRLEKDKIEGNYLFQRRYGNTWRFVDIDQKILNQLSAAILEDTLSSSYSEYRTQIGT